MTKTPQKYSLSMHNSGDSRVRVDAQRSRHNRQSPLPEGVGRDLQSELHSIRQNLRERHDRLITNSKSSWQEE
jgi:hypothetical protein